MQINSISENNTIYVLTLNHHLFHKLSGAPILVYLLAGKLVKTLPKSAGSQLVILTSKNTWSSELTMI